MLLATDFTPNSERAIARALRLARETGASLYVLHVTPSFPLKKIETTDAIVERRAAGINSQASRSAAVHFRSFTKLIICP